MKIINHTLDFSIPEESAITLGKFDGIHKGHQKLMHKILDKKASGLKSVVFTFGQMPGTVFDGKG
ncbi:MAG: bifunctional riboflavin kinase/FMN adenylyltransferase, partial [Lachnospiraceae bacterium]|nr:bifunctional riboflavin kinase/FMN adenylyltransferase [Lachnospiraceae bacterium]